MNAIERTRQASLHDALSVSSPLLFSLVLLVLLTAGCLGGDPSGTQPKIGDLDPGRSAEHGPLSLTVHPPVELPGPLSSEPSIVAAGDGVVAVAGPAGNSNPSVIPMGGYLWVSQDAGQSYTLRLAPDEPAPVVFCSCDTDVVALDGELVAATMYVTVYPGSNTNLVASEDQGETWNPRSLAAAHHQPIDRPWLESTVGGSLYLAYDQRDRFSGEATGDPDPLLIQHSQDGGQTWGPAEILFEDRGERAKALDPAAIGERTVLVPVVTMASERDAVVRVAVSHDHGSSFKILDISEPHPVHASFHASVDATEQGKAVIAWAHLDDDGTQKLRYRASVDEGDTWTPTKGLELPGSFTQPWVAVREDGLVAIAYYWSPEEGSIFSMDEETPWRPRLTLLDGSLAPIASANLSTEPTFHGLLCNHATSCPEDQPDRTPMREFLSTTWSPDGTELYTAWSDARATLPDDPDAGRITVTKLTVSGDKIELDAFGP